MAGAKRRGWRDGGKTWAARRYAGAGVGSPAVRGRAGHAGARVLRAGGSASPGHAGGQPGGTRARWARGRCGRASATGGRLGRPSGTRVRWARGCAGHAGVRVGSLPPLPPNLPVRPRYPPARLAPRRRPPGACPATPDIPQRAPGSPTRTQLPSEYRGASDSPARTHPSKRARLPGARLASTHGGRPTPDASGSQQTPSGRMPSHPRRAPGFPASTPGVRLAPSRRLPGARPATPGAHPAQRAPTHRSAPGSLARTWRAPAPRLSGHSRHGLRSLGPSGTRFWPFLPCFTSKQAFAMRKP